MPSGFGSRTRATGRSRSEAGRFETQPVMSIGSAGTGSRRARRSRSIPAEDRTGRVTATGVRTGTSGTTTGTRHGSRAAAAGSSTAARTAVQAVRLRANGMAWRFQRRRKLAPGVTLNVGRRGPSVRVGRRGAGVTVGRRRTASFSLLGSGLSFLWSLSRKRRR